MQQFVDQVLYGQKFLSQNIVPGEDIRSPKKGFFFNIKKFTPKISDMRWAELPELNRIVSRLVKLLGFERGPWMVLAGRLTRLWKLSGTRFLIAYLKECRLAIISWSNSEKYTPNPGVRLRLRPSGWPSVVPAALRVPNLGTMQNKLVFRGLHTVFNLYRVMDWKGAMPDFSSITNKFTGVSETLFPKEVAAVLQMLPSVQFPKGTVKPWVNTSAGPNHPWSTWSSGKDTLAWALNPGLLLSFVIFAWGTGQCALAIWLVALSHLVFPVAVFLRLRGVQLHLGCLAVLAKDGGGKRRIVGVVDFWSQWLLKPLHLYLFEVLRRIPQDGTFDQLGPIRSLLDFARLGHPAHSFDLSNATDRLPVKLQEQILSGLLGSSVAYAWRYLLTSRTYHHEKAGGLRYAVGQPIGALSSWAILALTHHVIIQVAAYRTGYQGWYPFYAVLGDDVVILGTRVAEEYLSIMRYLGVPINLGKSISSDKGLLEFAKRVVSAHHGDLSPVSGRLLLRSVRAPRFIADLLVNALDLGMFHFPSQVGEVIQRLGPEMNRNVLRGTAPLMIARAFILRRYQGVLRLPSGQWLDEWFPALLGRPMRPEQVELARDAVRVRKTALDFEVDYRRAYIEWSRFLYIWFRFPLFGGTLGGILSIPLWLLSPAPYAYLYTFVTSLSLLEKRIEAFREWKELHPGYDKKWTSQVLIDFWNSRVLWDLLDEEYHDPAPIPELELVKERTLSLDEMLAYVKELRSALGWALPFTTSLPVSGLLPKPSPVKGSNKPSRGSRHARSTRAATGRRSAK